MTQPADFLPSVSVGFRSGISPGPGMQRAGAMGIRLPWYVKFLLTYLAAITILGKGPTYLGIPPLYWGEVTLVISLFCIVPQIGATNFLRRTRLLSLFICLFMTLGAVLTAINLNRWRMDALRDAAIWYYGLFYFVGLGLASRPSLGNRVWYLLRWFWIWALVWNTADLISKHRLSWWGPVIPGRGVPVVFNGVHEAGQNLALGAMVVLCTNTLRGRPRLRGFLAAVALLGLVLFASSEGRGMRIGFAAGALTVMLAGLSPRGLPHFNTRLFKLAILLVPLLLMASIASPERAARLMHIDRFAQADPANPEGTAEWRLIWWQRIYEAVMRQNPLFGLGFGQSLHVYHPLLQDSTDRMIVRSPHNFNVTVFARMGIVGLLLWAAIAAIGIGSLFARVWRGSSDWRPYSADRRDELAFWIMMLVCTIVNSSFGVLMEGPVLGIWFWFALGFASARSFSTGLQPRVRTVRAPERCVGRLVHSPLQKPAPVIAEGLVV